MRGERFLIALMLLLASAFAHSSVLYKWGNVTPTLVDVYQMQNVQECYDEKLRNDDTSSWCEHKTNAAGFSVVYTWSGFQGDWYEVTGVRAGCSGTGSGWKNGVKAWDYNAGTWSDWLGACGSDGEKCWELDSAYFNSQTRQSKLHCSASGGETGAGNTAELFVDRVYYSYNWFPVANPAITPDLAFSHEDLSLVKNYSDVDGDQEENSSIDWFVNSELISSNETFLEGEPLLTGDIVRVEYTPCDSYGHCGQIYSVETTIQNHPPVMEEATGPGKARGGTMQVFNVSASDPDDQTVSLSCAVDDQYIVSNECTGTLSADVYLAFNCTIGVPEDTKNHSLECFLDDGLDKTFFSIGFETDSTPPEKGQVRMENNFTNQQALLEVETEGALFMRFACTEVIASNWAAYSTSYSFDLFGNGCVPGEGWKTVFVEFMDDVGNIQEDHASASVFLDMTPPTTSDSNDELIHMPGYEVTIEESDAHDESIETHYCTGISCSPTIPIDSGGKIFFTERGESPFKYKSCDSAGNEMEAQGIARINLLPAAEIALQPTSPTALTDIECVITSLSNEKEQEVTTTFAWYKNGAFLTENQSITAGQYVRGDNLTCVATLDDGLETSLANTTVAIENSAPKVWLSIKETNSIICDYSVTDADGDALNVKQAWIKNDEYYSNQTVIQDEEMSQGDVFSCLVNASDGFTTVSMKESYVVQSLEPVASSGSSGGGGSGGRSSGGSYSSRTPEIHEENPSEEPEEKTLGEKPEEKPKRTNEPIENKTEFVPEPLEEPIEQKEAATGLAALAPASVVVVVLAFIVLIGAKYTPRAITKTGGPKPPEGFSGFKKRWKKFPGGEDRKELALEIAMRLQEKYGSFHGAGIYQAMERLYGKDVKLDRIEIEKQINDFIKEEPEIGVHGRAGKKKLYRFKIP